MSPLFCEPETLPLMTRPRPVNACQVASPSAFLHSEANLCPQRASGFFFIFLLAILPISVSLDAQDSATGSIRRVVLDLAGARAPWASIVVVNTATRARYATNSDGEGRFIVGMLGLNQIRSGGDCQTLPRTGKLGG